MLCCWTRHAVLPARSAAIPTCRISSGHATSAHWRRCRTACWRPPLRMLRPGGRLIYAVCSLQPEEGAPRIEAALAGGGIRHDPFTPAELAGSAGGTEPRRLPAHTPRHVAGAWRHGRLLCRAPGSEPECRPCVPPGRQPTSAACRHRDPESRSPLACSPPISPGWARKARPSRPQAPTGCISTSWTGISSPTSASARWS